MTASTLTYADAKPMAKALRAALAEYGHTITHSQGLEIVARQFGLDDWNVLAARIETTDEPTLEPPMPIFRIFDVDRAMEFYVGFLGFKVDWEFRFDESFPLYCQISRSGFRMHLSEHSGEPSPGAKAFAHIRGIDALHAELAAKPYKYNRPGIQKQPWGRELTVTDPFSNRIAFCEPA
jgi:predicted enzyme related to lactoylglutathione lyase